jgi:hypothetical protein
VCHFVGHCERRPSFRASNSWAGSKRRVSSLTKYMR